MAGRRGQDHDSGDTCSEVTKSGREHTRLGDALTEPGVGWATLCALRSPKTRGRIDSDGQNPTATRRDARHSNGGHKTWPWNVDQRHERLLKI